MVDSCPCSEYMLQKLVRNIGKRALVVLCCFKKHVPKVNKKSELIDMNEKIPLLRNMRRHVSNMRRHVSKRHGY